MGDIDGKLGWGFNGFLRWFLLGKMVDFHAIFMEFDGSSRYLDGNLSDIYIYMTSMKIYWRFDGRFDGRYFGSRTS